MRSPAAGCEKEYKTDDARQIVVKEFGLDKVLTASQGLLEDFLPPGQSFRFYYYVLRQKGDEELFVIVPEKSSDAPYLAEWPLVESYSDIVEELKTRTTIEDWYQVELVDGTDSMEMIGCDPAELGICFAVCYGYCAAVQRDGKMCYYELEWLF